LSIVRKTGGYLCNTSSNNNNTNFKVEVVLKKSKHAAPFNQICFISRQGLCGIENPKNNTCTTTTTTTTTCIFSDVEAL